MGWGKGAEGFRLRTSPIPKQAAGCYTEYDVVQQCEVVAQKVAVRSH